MIPPERLRLLVCPVSRGPLHLDTEQALLISARAGIAFPIVAGVPVLLADAALPYPRPIAERTLPR